MIWNITLLNLNYIFKKAFLNKTVLSNFLQLSMFGAFLISRGKLFHKFGAVTIKDLSPNVLYVLKLTYLSKIPFELESNL